VEEEARANGAQLFSLRTLRILRDLRVKSCGLNCGMKAGKKRGGAEALFCHRFDSTFVRDEGWRSCGHRSCRTSEEKRDPEENCRHYESGYGRAACHSPNLWKTPLPVFCELGSSQRDGQVLKSRITPSIPEPGIFQKQPRVRLPRLGRLREYILPIAREFGILRATFSPTHFALNKNGAITGIDRKILWRRMEARLAPLPP